MNKFYYLTGYLLLIHYPTHAQFHFVETAEIKGIHFHQRNGSAEKRYLVEAKGGGVSVADVNGDGWDDIYFMNGGTLEEDNLQQDLAKNQLFLNQQNGTFRNATEESGLGDSGFGLGAYFADIDNDGDLDAYLTNYGPNQLYLNNGKGQFAPIDNAGKAQNNGFSTGAAFADVNQDGYLDLYVSNYAILSKEIADRMGTMTTIYGPKTFLGPKKFIPANDNLFINNGDGTFRDETKQRGINSFQTGRSFTAKFSDLDNDGDLDIYIANDMSVNILYENMGEGYFEDVSLFAGVGVSEMGLEQSGMGLAISDVDNDLDLDIAVANYQNETNVFYRNEGNLLFTDASVVSGVAHASNPLVCFGLLLQDYNNDSWVDLHIAAGHVYPIADQLPSMHGYEQPNPIYQNKGDGIFEEQTHQMGPASSLKGVSRGSAVADFDHDGDLDIVINNLDGKPYLLDNQSPNGNWLQLALQNQFGMPAYGARAYVATENRKFLAELHSSASFLSQNSATLHFGLGEAKHVKQIEIVWPDRKKQVIENLAINQKHIIRQSR